MGYHKWFTNNAEDESFLLMLKEMRALMDKYGMPKALMLVPDKLEISLKRNAYDDFHLFLKETFNYLPAEVVDFVVSNTINVMIQMGVPSEKISRHSLNSVVVELDLNLLPILEIIISEIGTQKRFSEEEFDQLLKTGRTRVKSFKEFSQLEFEWNEKIAVKFFETTMLTASIIQTNPSIVLELENIRKKYLH